MFINIAIKIYFNKNENIQVEINELKNEATYPRIMAQFCLTRSIARIVSSL